MIVGIQGKKKKKNDYIVKLPKFIIITVSGCIVQIAEVYITVNDSIVQTAQVHPAVSDWTVGNAKRRSQNMPM